MMAECKIDDHEQVILDLIIDVTELPENILDFVREAWDAISVKAVDILFGISYWMIGMGIELILICDKVLDRRRS